MEYNGYKLTITYKRVKHISARIKYEEICVTAPYFTNTDVIIKFLDTNINKIEKIMKKQEDYHNLPFMIWGKAYKKTPIKYSEDKVVLMDDMCYIYYKNDYLEALDKFFKNEVKNKVPSLIEKYQFVLDNNNLVIKKITIKKMTSRWGSCVCSKKFINLNSNLAKYDPIYLEYVFCHEIAHLKHADHSKNFHNFLKSYFPNEDLIRKELKKYF